VENLHSHAVKVEWLVHACSSNSMNSDSIDFVSVKLQINTNTTTFEMNRIKNEAKYLKARPASLDGWPKAWNLMVSVRCLRDAKYDSTGVCGRLIASLSWRVKGTWAVYFATVITVLIRSRLGNWPFAPSEKKWQVY
jgi:hypothetical protein